MFSQIAHNFCGKPLVNREIIGNLIANTTTKNGLRIQAEIDEGNYERGIKISDKEMEEINMQRDSFHGEWNYTISLNNR